MEPNWNASKSRGETFKRVIMKTPQGDHLLVELADYEEYMNARPDSVPKEAEIKVRGTEVLVDIIAKNDWMVNQLASAASKAGGVSEEEAKDLIKRQNLKYQELLNSTKPKGLFQRFLDLFRK